LKFEIVYLVVAKQKTNRCHAFFPLAEKHRFSYFRAHLNLTNDITLRFNIKTNANFLHHVSALVSVRALFYWSQHQFPSFNLVHTKKAFCHTWAISSERLAFYLYIHHAAVHWVVICPIKLLMGNRSAEVYLWAQGEHSSLSFVNRLF